MSWPRTSALFERCENIACTIDQTPSSPDFPLSLLALRIPLIFGLANDVLVPLIVFFELTNIVCQALLAIVLRLPYFSIPQIPLGHSPGSVFWLLALEHIQNADSGLIRGERKNTPEIVVYLSAPPLSGDMVHKRDDSWATP